MPTVPSFDTSVASGAGLPVVSSKPVMADYTLLHLAVQRGHLDIVKLLVGAGANLAAVDSVGRTCLHIAVLCGHADIVRYLCQETSMDVNVQWM